MRPLTVGAALALVSLAGCTRKPEAAAAPQAAAASPGAVRASRALVMTPPHGDAPADKAIAKLQAILAAQPDRIDALLLLGDAWIVKARENARPVLYQNAEACAELALLQQPENRQAMELKGLALMNDHQFEEARVLMAKVVTQAPDHPVAWGTLSDALLELGRTEEAVQAAQRMMDLKPNLPSYSRAAHLQWLHGDIASARESVRLAIDAGGGSKDTEPQAWVIVQAAMIFWSEGDLEGAEAGFDHALQVLPHFPPALQGKGRVLIARGQAKAAVPLLREAFAANPLVETGWLLGDALEAAGDAAGARAAWEAIERRGRADDPRTLALFWATKDRNHDEAVQLALAERAKRDDWITEDVASFALYRAGRVAEAKAASQKATALGTRDARLWFHAGAIALAAGDPAAGRALLTKALAQNPHFDVSGEAEARKLLGARLAADK